MGSGLLRITRVILGLGVALYLAIGVSALVRLLDAGVDVWSGAWALFDDGGFGLDDRMVPALWDQYFMLWGVTLLYWPIAAPLLVASARRYDATDSFGPGRALMHTLIPFLATFGLLHVSDSVARIYNACVPAPEDARASTSSRLLQLARAVPSSFGWGVGCAFASIFAIGLPPTPAKLVLLLGFMMPLTLPPLFRAAHLLVCLRALRELDERAAAASARAGHAASVGA